MSAFDYTLEALLGILRTALGAGVLVSREAINDRQLKQAEAAVQITVSGVQWLEGSTSSASSYEISVVTLSPDGNVLTAWKTDRRLAEVLIEQGWFPVSSAETGSLEIAGAVYAELTSVYASSR